MTQQFHPKHLKALTIWLFICGLSVFAMIIIGAITRLSGSGLSMVEWRPLVGALPPMNEAEWERVFELYKESPEYLKKNFWMELSDFKQIFFWEWFHRLLGRLISIMYFVPFVFFLIKKWIPRDYFVPLFFLFLLGGAQGFMGWYMVKSGLVDMPSVSHYRLAAHLSLALVILSVMVWLGLSFTKLSKGQNTLPDNALYNHGLLCLFFLCLTIFWGAYTAGLDAGLVYNDSFPKMGDTWIPEEIWFHQPVWRNFFENHAGVQFAHRWLAMITTAMIIGLVLHAGHKKRPEKSFIFLAVIVFIQLSLGIMTLYSHVDLHIAVSHQAGAVTLLCTLISCLHAARFKQPLPSR